MRAKCLNCKVWDKEEGKFSYMMANKTDWMPSSGYDPELRQFKCPSCGYIFYSRLTIKELRQEQNGSK